MGKRGESEKIRKSFLIDSTDERIINFIASQKNLSETIRHLIIDAESRIGNQDYFEYVTKEFRELKKEMQRLEQLKEATPIQSNGQNEELPMNLNLDEIFNTGAILGSHNETSIVHSESVEAPVMETSDKANESVEEAVIETSDEVNSPTESTDEHDAEQITDTPTAEKVDTTPEVPLKKDVSSANLRKSRKRK